MGEVKTPPAGRAAREKAVALAKSLCARPYTTLTLELFNFGPGYFMQRIDLLASPSGEQTSLVIPQQHLSTLYLEIGSAAEKESARLEMAAPLNTLLAGLADSRLVVYGASRCLKTFQGCLRRYAIEWPIPDDAQCLQVLYASYRGEWDDYYQSYIWVSLEQALDEMAIPPGSESRAGQIHLLLEAIAGTNP